MKRNQKNDPVLFSRNSKPDHPAAQPVKQQSAAADNLQPDVRQPHHTPSHRPDYEEEIYRLITSTASPKIMREKLADYHANDIAESLSRLDRPQRDKVFKMLDAQMLSEVLSYLDEEEQLDYLESINIRKAISILNEMEPQDAAALLRQMSHTRREVIIELLDNSVRQNLLRIVRYSSEEIGSQMTTDYIRLYRSDTIKDAMRSLIAQTREEDINNLSLLYVKDENGQYYGAIRIADLLGASADDSLEDIIEINFPFVYGSELISVIMDDLNDYAEDSIPVLDSANRIEGVITKQDLLEVFDREMGEDYARLAGLASEEDLEESLFASLKKRTPWLLMLLVLSLGVSTVVSLFEGVVAKLTIAVVFQSLVLDMAGNVGTQSLAVSIRVLADGALGWKEKLRLIFKETRTGLVNGLILGSGSALLLSLYIRFFCGYQWLPAIAIALCIGLAMMVSMMISSFTGTAIPVAFKSMNLDPAAASGPLITTINDLIGVTTYYGLVWIFLIQMLHL